MHALRLASQNQMIRSQVFRAQAALQAVLYTLVASVAAPVPHWDGRAIDTEWRLEGLPMQHGGKPGVRCVLRHHQPGIVTGIFTSAHLESSVVKCTLGTRELHVRLLQREEPEGAWKRLYCYINTVTGESTPHSYGVRFFAVGEGDPQHLRDAQFIGNSQSSYQHELVHTAKEWSTGWGISQWARKEELRTVYPDHIYVCADVWVV